MNLKVKKIRIGMVGCGQIMPSTADGILSSKHCEMSCLFDIDSDILTERATAYHVKTESDFWQFIARDDIDAIYLAVPHALHAPLAVESIRAGKHVMIEKPLATNINDAKMILDESKKAKVKVGVAMAMRFDGRVELTKKLIEDGVIGSITNTRAHAIGYKDKNYWSNGVGGEAKRSAWRAYKGMAGGGILIMNAVHNLDAMYYMTGLKPVEVMSMGGSFNVPAAVENAISVLIRYDKNNSYGVCEAMSSAFGASHTDDSTAIYGTKGTIKFSELGIDLFTSNDSSGYETNKWVNLAVENVDIRAALMDDFALAIINGTSPRINAEEGLLIVDMICSAYKSLESGSVEKLAQT